MNSRLMIMVLALASGCAPTQTARKASRGVIDESAEQLTKPETQEKLLQAADSPVLQRAADDLSERIAEGVLKSFSSDRTQAQLSSLTRGMTASLVHQTFAALNSDETRAAMMSLSDGVTASVLRRVNESVAGELRPTMQTILREDVPQAVAQGIQQALAVPTVGPAARTVGYNLTLGATDGLTSLSGSSDSTLATLPEKLHSMLWLALAVAGLLTVLVAAAAAVVIARVRQASSEARRLESATLLLVTALRERVASQPGDEVLAIVEAALQGRAEKSGTHRIHGVPDERAVR